jgi:hypothetical protein
LSIDAVGVFEAEDRIALLIADALDAGLIE